MPWLIMNDEVDYESTWYPTHIVSKDKKVLPVFIGASQTLLLGLVGIWIKDEHYDLIDHTKAYILIHNPEAIDEDIVDIDWSKMSNVDEPKTTGREHIHLWKEMVFRDGEIKEGEA